MRAFITGGTGFVGSNLVRELNARGMRPRILHRGTSSMERLVGLDFESVVGDVLDPPEQLARRIQGCDVVFHVAAVADYWRQSTEWLYKVNVTGTRHMLSATRLAGNPRFIYTSSIAAMGVPKPDQLLDEASEFNLNSGAFPYAHSKVLAEAAVREATADGLPAVIVNPTVVAGAGDANEIIRWLVVAVHGGRLPAVVPGGVNIVDVMDVARGLLAAAREGRSGERYILGGTNVLYRDAIITLASIANRRPPLFSVPGWSLPIAAILMRWARRLVGPVLPVDDGQMRLMNVKLFADVGKARRELRLATTSFRDTVQNTYDWYNEHGYLE